MDCEAEIARKLDTAPPPGSPNRITAQELKGWALEYLEDRDEVIAAEPEETGRPHWDLLMSDDRLEDALFAVLVFGTDDVEFFCGTGISSRVRHFCHQEAPDQPDGMFNAMRRRFTVSETSLRLDWPRAEGWLGRSW